MNMWNKVWEIEVNEWGAFVMHLPEEDEARPYVADIIGDQGYGPEVQDSFETLEEAKAYILDELLDLLTFDLDDNPDAMSLSEAAAAIAAATA